MPIPSGWHERFTEHTERLGTWKIRQQGDDEQKRYTSMRALLGWLGARYEMHHNTLSNQYEVRAINTGEKLYLDWTEVDTPGEQFPVREDGTG